MWLRRRTGLPERLAGGPRSLSGGWWVARPAGTGIAGQAVSALPALVHDRHEWVVDVATRRVSKRRCAACEVASGICSSLAQASTPDREAEDTLPAPTSVGHIDLSPVPGKRYFNGTREWAEEFIYFVMVDRFHDDAAREPVLRSGRSAGVPTHDDFYGGTLRGVTEHLDYIAGLGCTSIWLSPIFESNAGAYHGYNINNYLDVDPHFGTTQDLKDLVDAAHARDIRVILDVVLNHSGDNWSYPDGFRYFYSQDERFAFGAWRRADRPIPTELRNPTLYHRRGEISGSDGYDASPEAQHGDMFGLKNYVSDDDEAASELIEVLIRTHCYWIREADVDGFRVDAAKHMGELACARFSSAVREYAHSLGKRGFFLLGEVASANDEVIDRYIGQYTSRLDSGKTVFFGLDSVLDFRLGADLPGVIKGFSDPRTLFDRVEEQRRRAMHRGEIGRFLVSFIDNHDAFWQTGGRFANGSPDEQVIAAMGYLLCALGTACIYYGTEQGFSGSGGDNEMREAMFDRQTPGRNLLNSECRLYRETAKLARIMRDNEVLRFGRMYFREISANHVDFGLPYGNTYTLAFSRILYGREVLVAYNVSSEARSDGVIVDRSIQGSAAELRYIYGSHGTVPVEASADDRIRYVRLDLDPHQFVILE